MTMESIRWDPASTTKQSLWIFRICCHLGLVRICQVRHGIFLMHCNKEPMNPCHLLERTSIPRRSYFDIQKGLLRNCFADRLLGQPMSTPCFLPYLHEGVLSTNYAAYFTSRVTNVDNIQLDTSSNRFNSPYIMVTLIRIYQSQSYPINDVRQIQQSSHESLKINLYIWMNRYSQSWHKTIPVQAPLDRYIDHIKSDSSFKSIHAYLQ